MTIDLKPARLTAGDLMRTSLAGLRNRRLRAALSALGIMIGIAAVVGVLGLSQSSKSDLLAQLDRLGTNLVTVQAGQGIGIGSGELPESAAAMIGRINPVEAVAAVAAVDANVYRSDLIPSTQSGGISILAADPDLLEAIGGEMADGVWLSAAAPDYPVVVLGAVAAERLGISDVDARPLVWLGEEWFAVIGVLEPLDLAADVDRSVLIGPEAADSYLGSAEPPSKVFVRTDPAFVDDVMGVLSATANPENPEEVEVERPTDALEAREAADDTLTLLFLGLGAVALLVGGVGIANVMVISVLERRAEIGLRRALGATRRQVGTQFLSEALLLSLVGGLGGVALGAAATAAYSRLQNWDVLIPPIAIFGGLGAALLIGAVAGLYPAIRASRLSPTEALRTT
jgi:putative ABC transport system permease protein